MWFLILIILAIIMRYVFVLVKYIKTGEFKKKIYKGNMLGIIAYSCVTVLIISFLTLMILVSKDKSSDLVMWILFISGIFTLFAYPSFWMTRTAENSYSKNEEFKKVLNEEFKLKYGDEEEYDKLKHNYFDIPDDCVINDKFNELVSLITNEQITFIHPNEYKNVADVFSFLYQNDYMKLWGGNDSLPITCEKINSLLNKNNLDLKISEEDIIKDDNEFIKARRRDLVPTVIYDLNKINDIIKKHLNDYEIIEAQIYNRNSLCNYPTYYCIVKSSEYNNFFNKKIYTIPSTGDFNLYFNKGIEFNNLDKFFAEYKYDVVVQSGSNIYIKSKDSNDAITSEFCVSDEKYKEYLLDFETDCREDDPENNENWIVELEKMKKFDSYYMINSKSEIESKYIILLALYILKENGDVLLYDCYNGIYLDSNKLKSLVISNE